MFTGLVETTGSVHELDRRTHGIQLTIHAAGFGPPEVSVGDSIAVRGCCLTVVEVHRSAFRCEAGEETLRRTVLGQLAVSDAVNLERSLQVGASLGGHFVTGHIDCVGQVDRRQDDAEWCTMWFRIPHPWMRHLAEKGSIAVDGVSLTVVAVEEDRFSVALIPHTLEMTTLGRLTLGDAVNIETDILAKYVEKAVAAGGGN